MKRLTRNVAPLAIALALGATPLFAQATTSDPAVQTTTTTTDDDRDEGGFNPGWLGLLGLAGLLGMRKQQHAHTAVHDTSSTARRT